MNVAKNADLLKTYIFITVVAKNVPETTLRHIVDIYLEMIALVNQGQMAV
jgi:hypothetical protein